MGPERTPVLVGVGQRVWREVDPKHAPSPLDALEQVSRAAAEDAGAGAKLLDAVDSVGLIDVMGWRRRSVGNG